MRVFCFFPIYSFWAPPLLHLSAFAFVIISSRLTLWHHTVPLFTATSACSGLSQTSLSSSSALQPATSGSHLACLSPTLKFYWLLFFVFCTLKISLSLKCNNLSVNDSITPPKELNPQILLDTHTHTHTHMYTQTYIHTHTRARAHVRVHTCTHKHTYEVWL